MTSRTDSQVVCFIVNGIAATMIHYGVLTFNLHVLEMASAGFANLYAAAFGITASFLGNRYFVFRSRNERILHEASRFMVLYGAIACLHGLILFVWTDLLRLDYRAGFLIATFVQVSFSFWGNKTLIFKS